MNVYCFELKKLLRPLLVWSLTILAILLLLMKLFFPAMMASRPEIAAVLSNYSPEVLQALGLNLDQIFSYGGFYVFSYTYIGLLAAIMAASLTMQVMAREKRSKCSEFILTKPLWRGRIFLAKLLAVLSALILFNLFYAAVVAVDFSQQALATDAGISLVQLILAPFFTQLVFLALATVYAVAVRRLRSVSGAATSFGFAALLLSGLVEMLELDWLNYVAPLQYFNPAFVLEEGSFAPHLVLTAALVFLVALMGAAWRNQRQDIAVI